MPPFYRRGMWMQSHPRSHRNWLQREPLGPLPWLSLLVGWVALAVPRLGEAQLWSFLLLPCSITPLYPRQHLHAQPCHLATEPAGKRALLSVTPHGSQKPSQTRPLAGISLESLPQLPLPKLGCPGAPPSKHNATLLHPIFTAASKSCQTETGPELLII